MSEECNTVIPAVGGGDLSSGFDNDLESEGWIPASAGMTEEGVEMTEEGVEVTEVGRNDRDRREGQATSPRHPRGSWRGSIRIEEQMDSRHCQKPQGRDLYNTRE